MAAVAMTIPRTFSTIAKVYRLHHAPVVPITLKSLLSRSPVPPAEGEDLATWQHHHLPRIVSSAQHLHHEIPIRLASRIVDLESLPDGLSVMPSVVALREQLLTSFEALVNAPIPTDRVTERAYMALHTVIRQKHATMHHSIQDALSLWTQHQVDPSLTNALDQFYHSRIGIRLLIDQHCASQHYNPGCIGLIATACQPMAQVRQVVKKLSGSSTSKVHLEIQGDTEASFTYLPSHLDHMLTKVLKHAMHASSAQQPITIEVAGGNSGVSIKVSDQGGGMPWEQVERVWSYLSATSEQPSSSIVIDPVGSPEEANDSLSATMPIDPFGLPIARLYARYFGGELTMMPMEGKGTDCYIHLKRLT